MVKNLFKTMLDKNFVPMASNQSGIDFVTYLYENKTEKIFMRVVIATPFAYTFEQLHELVEKGILNIASISLTNY